MTVVANREATPIEPAAEPTFEEQLIAEFTPAPAAEDPASAVTPPVDDGAEAPSPAAASEGGERTEGSETPQPPAPSAVPPVADPAPEPISSSTVPAGEPDPNVHPALQSLPEHYEILGQKITPAEAEAMIFATKWMNSLTPEQVAGIERVIAETTGTAPAQPAPAVVAPVAAPAPAPIPAPVVAPPVDPYEDPAMTQLRAEMAQLQAQLQAQQVPAPVAPIIPEQLPIQPPQMDATLLAHRSAVSKDVMEGYQSNVGLNDAEMELIGQRIIQSGELGSLEQRTGDFRAALTQAVEQQVWLDPFFRDKAIAARQAQTAATDAATAERKANSSALASSTGSVARAPAATDPGTKAGRMDALTAAIATAMREGN